MTGILNFSMTPHGSSLASGDRRSVPVAAGLAAFEQTGPDVPDGGSFLRFSVMPERDRPLAIANYVERRPPQPGSIGNATNRRWSWC